MKKIYMIPVLRTQQLGTAEGLLLSGSDGTEKILDNGGTTSGNVTESDVKSGYNVWNDDWSN